MKVFKFIKGLNGNTAKYTAITSILLIAASLLNNYVLDQPGPRLEISIDGRGNNVVVHDVPYDCPTGWDRTDGQDPDTKAAMIVCESTDDRYVITVRDGVVPSKVFDGVNGVWLPYSQVVQ